MRLSSPHRRALIVATAALTAGGITAAPTAPAAAASLPDTPGYNLPLALQESLYFYDAQKSGPARTDSDQPLSWRGDFEPGDSAALVGALAGLETYYGSEVTQPMTNFTAPSFSQDYCTEYSGTCTAPYYATATLNQDSIQGTQLTVNINNMADEPPHLQTGMSARVYFDISSLVKAGQSISAVSTPVYYDAADQIDGTPPRSAPRSSGVTRTAASTTSPSTGAKMASACRRRARSSSASTRPRPRRSATRSSWSTTAHRRCRCPI